MVNGLFSIPLGVPLSEPGVSAVPDEYVADGENPLLATVFDARRLIRRGFNPLVLSGPTGVGKSLLARGLVARWSSDDSPTDVVTCSGSDFCRLYREAIETDAIDEFRRKVRDTEFLLVDDLTELSGKEAAQLELAGTIDELVLRKKLVIATTRTVPGKIPRLVPQLISRLVQGLVVPVRPPGAEARRELTVRYARRHDLQLSEQAIQWLVRSGPSLAGDLQGLLLQLKLNFAEQLDSANPEAVQQYLSDSQRQTRLSLHGLTKLVARRFRLKVSDLKSASRRQTVVRARGVAIYLARQHTDLSLERLGDYFGKRDHTTVLHSCRQTEQRITSEPELREVVEEIVSQLAPATAGR